MTDYEVGQAVSAFYDGVPVKCTIVRIAPDGWIDVQDVDGKEFGVTAVNVMEREDTDAESVARIDEWIARPE